MAIGVAVSVLIHTTVAWTITRYVSAGESRDLELEARGLAAESSELVGEFADPAEGRVSGTYERSDGSADRPGEPIGEVGPAPTGAEKRVGTAGGEPTPSRDGAGEDVSDPPEEPERTSAADDRPTKRPSPEGPTAPPDSLENTGAGTPENSGDTESEPSQQNEEAAASRAAGGSDTVDERRPRTKPSFPSIDGDGTDATGTEGSGNGAGTRGGVALARIEEVFRAHRDEIRKCYAKHHDYISDGTKVVIVEFWIGTDGTVPRVRTVHRTTNLRVADCMKERIAELEFPEVDETVSFVKQFTIDARIEADWVKPRLRGK